MKKTLLMVGLLLALENLSAQKSAEKSHSYESSKEAEQNKLLAEKNAKQAEKNAAIAQTNARKAEANALIAEQNAKKAEHNTVVAKANARKAEANALIAEQNAKKVEQNAKKTENIANRIIKDLLQDKFISDTNNISFRINNEEFIVNGKTMERKVHLTYRNKYQLKEVTTISYSKTND